MYNSEPKTQKGNRHMTEAVYWVFYVALRSSFQGQGPFPSAADSGPG